MGKKGGVFNRIWRDLEDSEAWNDLDFGSRVVYHKVLNSMFREARGGGWVNRDEGWILIGPAIMGLTKMDRRTFRGKVDKLVRYGFLDLIRKGSFGPPRKMAVGLSERWRDWRPYPAIRVEINDLDRRS